MNQWITSAGSLSSGQRSFAQDRRSLVGSSVELRQTAGPNNLGTRLPSPGSIRSTRIRSTEPHRAFLILAALNRSIVGEPGEEFQVSDRSEVIAITDRKIDALQQRWHKLRSALAKSDSERASFHPLTAHFFVKAFFERGNRRDLSANISCIEATWQLPGERTRKNLIKRYHCLVNDEVSCQWLDSAYGLRNMCRKSA